MSAALVQSSRSASSGWLVNGGGEFGLSEPPKNSPV